MHHTMSGFEITALVAVTIATAMLALVFTRLARLNHARLRGCKPQASVTVVYVGTAGLALLCLLVAGVVVQEVGVWVLPATILGYIAFIEAIFIINAGRVASLSAKRDRSQVKLADLLAQLDEALDRPETGPLRRFLIRLQRQMIRLNLKF